MAVTDINVIGAKAHKVRVNITGYKIFYIPAINVGFYFLTDNSVNAVSTLQLEDRMRKEQWRILLTDLRVAGAGAAPVSEAAALTALEALF